MNFLCYVKIVTAFTKRFLTKLATNQKLSMKRLTSSLLTITTFKYLNQIFFLEFFKFLYLIFLFEKIIYIIYTLYNLKKFFYESLKQIDEKIF